MTTALRSKIRNIFPDAFHRVILRPTETGARPTQTIRGAYQLRTPLICLAEELVTRRREEERRRIGLLEQARARFAAD